MVDPRFLVADDRGQHCGTELVLPPAEDLGLDGTIASGTPGLSHWNVIRGQGRVGRCSDDIVAISKLPIIGVYRGLTNPLHMKIPTRRLISFVSAAQDVVLQRLLIGNVRVLFLVPVRWKTID